MAVNVSIPKGTRDFGPLEMRRRNYIFDNIKEIFNLHGYLPIETPAMENLSTLLGKYGEEGDKLLFRILNSGDFTKEIPKNEFTSENLTKLSSLMCEKGLRYDLTVPFARFVVQHRNEINFPFKRYQIQPVWRADRPQKGRYREFFQCDVDVIGSDSLFNEYELLQIIDKVFQKLGINVIIKINNRKILAGIAARLGMSDNLIPMTIAIDKIEKIGRENTKNELLQIGIQEADVESLLDLISTTGSIKDQIVFLKKYFKDNEIGLKGVAELEEIISYVEMNPIKNKIEIDLSLARGLNYYTGSIIEVKAADFQIGSICGGGRYDDLTGIFGLKDVSGVGVSFGADRIYDVMLGLNLFPEFIESAVKVLFVNFGNDSLKTCIALSEKLRKNNISCEIYPQNTKLDKQFKYANAKNIEYVAIIGEYEFQSKNLNIKNLHTGTQEQIPFDEIATYFKNR
ncbi:MAG: histidine--tRNA ligase [Bacteroidales bacterium]|jgi:histidyl-tRNA synthetase|nr:histidine--tRNA ligase [Bacteroidales bacterium]HOL97057.1 histidine--tRNA ligase [Bacteroidales bacterium]HOM35966.1 histidine--tRNA ligase [Bacteroidales bacterium]HPD23420.1 histidine--tRNA ligase [Bacteroidales bacterium]HRS99412.1 histidine--tRNA ligase [Bacteroidales bacterium]